MTKVISLRRKPVVRKASRKSDFKKSRVDAGVLSEEKYKILLTVAAIAAMLAGSLIYRALPNEAINGLIAEKIGSLRAGSFLPIFLNFIKLDALFIFFAFFLGTSFLGSSIAFLPVTLKCVLIGYIGSYFYNEFELKGVLFCLLLLYPYFVITTASLIFASNEGVYMSNYILRLLGNKNTADDISVRLYLLRYLVLIVINIACAAVNSGLVTLLAPRITL